MLIICVQVSWSFSTGGPCAHRHAARRGSSIRGIKIISKDINFELWPHNVDTDTSLRTMYRLIYAVGAPRWQKYFKSISLGECCVPSVFTIITDNFRHSPSWLRNPFFPPLHFCSLRWPFKLIYERLIECICSGRGTRGLYWLRGGHLCNHNSRSLFRPVAAN